MIQPKNSKPTKFEMEMEIAENQKRLNAKKNAQNMVGPTLTNENLSPIKIKPSTKGSKTSKNEMKGKVKTKKKGELEKTKPEPEAEHGQKKYDWDAIKREFMESNYLQVAPFMRQRHGQETANNKHIAEKTQGWGDEKKKIRAEIEAKAMEDFKANLGDQWKQAFAKIEMAHLKGLESLTDMILHQGEVDRVENIIRWRDRDTGEIREITENEDTVLRPYLNHGDIVNILKHLKIEKGEPTEIFETGNTSKTRKWMEEMRKGKESIV